MRLQIAGGAARSSGGGNRHEVRDVVRGANLAAKVGRHYYADNTVFNSPLATPHSLKKSAYTLAEIIIVLVVIAVVVAATMRVAKTRLDNITTYTYYAAYSVLNDVTGQMLADYSPSRNEYIDVAFIKRFLPLGQGKEVFATRVKPADMYQEWKDCNGYANCIDKIFSSETTYYYSGVSDFYDKYNDFYNPDDGDFKLMDGQLGTCSGKYIYYDNAKEKRYKTTCSTGYELTYPDPDARCNRWCGDASDKSNCGYIRYNCVHEDPNYGSNNCQPYRSDYDINNTWQNYSFGVPGLSGAGSSDMSMYFRTIDTRVKENGYLEYVVGHLSDVRAGYIVSGQSMGHGICRYKVRCRKDALGGSGKYPANFGILSNLIHGCTPSCPQGTEWIDMSGSGSYNIPDGYTMPGCYSEYQCPAEECQSGSVWRGEPTCSCVPEPPTIPRKGINFCNMFVSLANTKAGEMCKGTKVEADTTDFSGITEDIILRNGMKIYNASQNPDSIADLVGNETGGTVTKTDGTTFDTNIAGYTLYVDIDGSSGESKLWEDVFPFYVTLSGKVIPAYKTDALGEFGGDSRYYMQTSIQVGAVDSVGATQYWLLKSKSFKESACKAGYVGQNTLYCSRHDENNSAVTKDVTCSQEQNSCSVKKVSPIRGF